MDLLQPLPDATIAATSLSCRRILHIDRGREMRGGQHQALLLMKGLQVSGIDQVLLARPNAPLAEAAANSGIPTFDTSYRTLRRFRGWAHLTHAHDADAHLRALLADCHPLVVARRVAFPIATGLLSRWKYRKGDRYIAVSRHVSGILTNYGIPPFKVRTVYDGVPALPPPVQRRDIVALLSGDDGKCNSLIREAAALGGFEVIFARDLPNAFLYARLFIYLSRAEGFGSAAALAFSAGIPVVASQIPALEEIFDGVQAGALVENNPAAISAAVLRLISDDTLALACGQAARAQLAPRFTIEKMVSGTIAVYEELW